MYIDEAFIDASNYAATGSLPRAIRQNMTHFGLWRLRNQNTLDLISKELSRGISILWLKRRTST
jgi:hypothetical protein